MLFKTISLTFEGLALQIDRNTDCECVVLRLNDFVLDVENSKPGDEIYKNGNLIEIYPTLDEVKEMIKALQNILPEEEQKHEGFGFHIK